MLLTDRARLSRALSPGLIEAQKARPGWAESADFPGRSARASLKQTSYGEMGKARAGTFPGAQPGPH